MGGFFNLVDCGAAGNPVLERFTFDDTGLVVHIKLMRKGYCLALLLLACGVLFAKETADISSVKKQAEQGDAQAQFSLAVMYGIGEGLIKDDAEAVKWYRKAAEQGDAQAQFSLAVMYGIGEGVIKDLIEAHAWLNLASALGEEKGKEAMVIAEKQMTKEQIAEATKLARERFEKIKSDR